MTTAAFFDECSMSMSALMDVKLLPDGNPPLKAPPGLLLPKLKLHEVSEASTCSRETSLSSGELSPWSCRSADNTPRYERRDQTIIILDWDDTILPTTVCRDGEEHTSSVDLSQALEPLAAEAVALFRRASELADKVVIVTNAGEGWVEWSCAEWLPNLLPALGNIEIVSARSVWEPLGVSSPTAWKEHSFRGVIEHFYSQYPNQSWKNIICVGDSTYEHEALEQVVTVEQLSGRCKRSRAKSVKFMPQPSVDQLRSQLAMLCGSLGEIAFHDDDIFTAYLADFL
jgi:hypothetical protein